MKLTLVEPTLRWFHAKVWGIFYVFYINSLSHSDTVHKKCKCVLQQLFFCFFKLFGQLPPSQIGKDIAFESGLSLLVNK